MKLNERQIKWLLKVQSDISFCNSLTDCEKNTITEILKYNSYYVDNVTIIESIGDKWKHYLRLSQNKSI